MPSRRILLTGATGFVGSHLYPALAAQYPDVVCASRKPDVAARAQPERSFAHFDMGDARSMRAALTGCTDAVFLVHGMASAGDYVEAEHEGAKAFREAAADAGVTRIVYLGGMRPSGTPSRHLRSRLATGETLRAGRVPTIELQATMIIGAGSESFRMVRDLSARLPMMILPAWSKSLSQPIAIADVVFALVHALGQPAGVSGAFPLPGPETLSAREILLRTAQLLGHHPRMFGVPFVTPKLSSYWIRLITRVDPHIAEELVEGLRSDIVHDGPGYWAHCPGHGLTSFDQAVVSALSGEARSLGKGARAVEQLIDHLSPKEPHGPA
jgi:uncharacterized protein YbjT (DUF2867 family)